MLRLLRKLLIEFIIKVMINSNYFFNQKITQKFSKVSEIVRQQSNLHLLFQIHMKVFDKIIG